ncbi:MAG: hypothetical protein QM767_24725 [Anaeromyxobacter sp.]
MSRARATPGLRLRGRWLALLILVALPGLAAGQTMADQEERLIELHSLLLDLPALQAPGALAGGQWDLSVELVTIPVIDGATGAKTQITASDRTRLFPRPRASVGLGLPGDFRAFLGGAYVPPVKIREVATHDLSLEAGLAWVPGAFRAGLRVRGVYARSTSPVTDPDTRDELLTRLAGAELSVGGHFMAGKVTLEPYAGAGVVTLRGRFEVTSDGNVLESDYTGPTWDAGLRLLAGGRWEVVGEVVGYPDRMVHPNFRVGYVFQ